MNRILLAVAFLVAVPRARAEVKELEQHVAGMH